MAAALPDDVLTDVLRRLDPRSLAACRCVCKPWRDLIHARRRRNLSPALLPRSLAGIYVGGQPTRRPSQISGTLHFLPSTAAGDDDNKPRQPRRHEIQDHCNGLLLLGDPDNDNRAVAVVNPATRWHSSPLPPRPPPWMGESTFPADFLVYDPAVSSDYEILSVPCFRRNCSGCCCSPSSGDAHRVLLDEFAEWPPLLHTLDVYSSSTGRWEERTFHRQGKAVRPICDMRFDFSGHKCKAVYWRGALYVHYKTYFIMRISLSDDKYQVIRMPEVKGISFPIFCLGRSEKGMYLALLIQPCTLRVWVIDESSDKMEWVLKHDKELNLVFPHQNHRGWILQDLDKETKYHKEEKDLEWRSDDENNVIPTVYRGYRGRINVLGFHPYKEIVFLCKAFQTGLAYHLNTSKIDILGNLKLATSYDEVLSDKNFIAIKYQFKLS
uniref:F-box domain-containing protein n=1 Tax=Leersia perrieri TaxID=77586 RepID=A0A0D9VX87_9ORYZ